MLDAKNTSPEVEHSSPEIAVLGVGAIEQHGPHLPLGTDWMEADAVARGIAKELDAYLLPALPFSNSQAHASFRGTVSLTPETLAAVVGDVVSSLFAQGFKKVVVVNLHGGNTILRVAIRELNYRHPDAKVLLVNPWIPAISGLKRLFPDFDNDLHAGDFETSLMLALEAGFVKSERQDQVPEGMSGEFFDYLPTAAMSPNGVWGRPSLATAEKGQAALKIMVERSAEHIRDTFRKIQ